MNVINKVLKAKIVTCDCKEYEVKIPKTKNDFRFFPDLSKIAGTTTKSIVKLTIDSIILPKELFRQDIMGKYFTLNAKVLVGEANVDVYELDTEIKVPINAYAARNVKSVEDDSSIEISPLQIEIPAFKMVSLKTNE